MSLAALVFVAASSAQAQAILTAAEARYRSSWALQTHMTVSALASGRSRASGPALPPYGGTLLVQNPGMLAFHADLGSGAEEHVTIDGLRILAVIRVANPAVPTNVRVFDLTSSSAESEPWTWVAALFVGKRALSEKWDFELRATNSRFSTLAGIPLRAGWWSKMEVDIDNQDSTVRELRFQAGSGIVTALTFDRFTIVSPPGREAFSTRVPSNP